MEISVRNLNEYTSATVSYVILRIKRVMYLAAMLSTNTTRHIRSTQGSFILLPVEVRLICPILQKIVYMLKKA
jgi:hypothetical protein